MSTLPVSFPNADGVTLAGRLDLPDAAAPRAYALFAHCFTCSKDLRAARRIAQALTDHDIGVLRFDFTGLGHSEGDFADTTFSSNTDDLVAAAEWLAEHHEAPSILIGHSLGGAAVLRAATRIPSSKAVVTIGAPAEPEHVAELLRSSREQIERDGTADVELAGRRFSIRKEFLEDLEAADSISRIADLRRALLVLHSPRDLQVGIDNARAIYVAARHPKSFVTLDGADHLLTDPRDALYAGRMIASWVERYLPEVAASEVDEQDLEGHAVLSATGATGFRTELRLGRHRLVADEPESVGGGDEGPTPYDLLNAALGACTSMTLRMYADRKKLPLEGVKVRLRHSKVHAADCAECETKTGKVDRIEREIELLGPLTDDQRSRLLQIADKCPVHRTLHNELTVVSRLRGSMTGP